VGKLSKTLLLLDRKGLVIQRDEQLVWLYEVIRKQRDNIL